MSINSVSSSGPQPPPLPKVAPAGASRATRGDKDLKGDGDAARGTTKASAAKPVGDTLGQVIGRALDVTA